MYRIKKKKQIKKTLIKDKNTKMIITYRQGSSRNHIFQTNEAGPGFHNYGQGLLGVVRVQARLNQVGRDVRGKEYLRGRQVAC